MAQVSVGCCCRGAALRRGTLIAAVGSALAAMLLAAAILSSALAAAGDVDGDEAETSPPAPAMTAAEAVAKGQALLEENCARCHSVGAVGASPHKEAPPFRVVVSRYPPDNLAEALAEGLVSGHPDMPEFVFEADEVGAITAYLNSLEPKAE